MENIEIKLNSLEEAVSYPSLKKHDLSNVCVIEVDTFDFDLIQNKIKENEKLTNLEGAKMDLILDILKLLSDHKIKFNVELHNIIGFYFRGLLLLAIKVTGTQTNNLDRLVYVSVKVYKDELERRMNDKRLSKIMAGTIGGIIIIGGALISYSFIKSRQFN